MLPISHLVHFAGGAIATHELHAAGFTRARIGALLDAGRLHRVRQGWYTLPELAPAVRRAVRVGGIVTCAAALAAHDVWAVSDGVLHVRVRHGDCRLRSPDHSRQRLANVSPGRVRVHWTTRSPLPSRIIATPEEALADWFSCVPRDWALGALGSLLRQKPTDADALRARFGVSEWEGVDGRCESGTETVFFIRMLRQGIHPWRQVRLPGSSPFDFLIGTRLLVEVDGATYHDQPEQFARDRAKDALAHTLGFLPLRFSHNQVLHEWPVVEATVGAIVERGDHLR